MKRLFEKAQDEMDIFGVVGFAFLPIFICSKVFSHATLAYNWWPYLILGTLFPATMFLFSIGKLEKGKAFRRLQYFCILFFLSCAALFIKQNYSTSLFLIIFLEAIFVYWVTKTESSSNRLTDLCVLFVVILSWIVGAKSAVNDPFLNVGHWLSERPHRIVVFVLSTILVSVALFYHRKMKARTGFWALVPALTGLCVLAFFSSQTAYLFNGWETSLYCHWGTVIGPAKMVQEGGWLLWDVPGFYGFLSTLTLAVLPFKTAYQSLYFLNSLLLWLAGSIIFLMLLSSGSSFRNFLFSLMVPIAALYIIPKNELGELHSGMQFPSIGPYRWVWCYALLALLFWYPSVSVKRFLQIGTAFWFFGVLWSCESAAGCTVIWIPVYMLSLWNSKVTQNRSKDLQRKWTDFLKASLAPLALLAGFLVILSLYYWFRLGRFPDLRGYYETSSSRAAGYFGFAVINNQGTIWVIFMVFSAVSFVTFYLLRREKWELFLRFLGVWGAIWAVTAIFVSRSTDGNLIPLLPFICIFLGFFLRYFPESRPKRLILLAMMPLLIVVISVPFTDKRQVFNFISSLRNSFEPHVERLVPIADPFLVQLLNEAHVGPTDRVIRLDYGVWHMGDLPQPIRNPQWQTDQTYFPKAWLPMPADLFSALAVDRRHVYLSRFSSRRPFSGWLYFPTNPLGKENDYSVGWFFDYLKANYYRTAIYKNEHWHLLHFEPRMKN